MLLDDFQFILNTLGEEDVYINQSENPTRVIVTNTNQNDVRKITGLEELNAGDEIHYNDANWLIITTSNKRYDKFLGLMRQCNLNPFYWHWLQLEYHIPFYPQLICRWAILSPHQGCIPF